MAVVVLAGAGMVGLFLLLGLFGGKGGPSETRSPPSAPSREGTGWLLRLDGDGLERLLHRLFQSMRFEVVSSDVRGPILDMVVRDPAPVVGGQVHVRGIVAADHGMVGEAEVQAALDLARGDSLAKAVVVSPLGFSAEARLAVRDTACELLDAPALTALLDRHLPEAVETSGAGYA
ncbi:MAG: restriction endonuclease [Deltaproteobacteria bacterium]